MRDNWLTVKKCRELFTYDSESGELRWKINLKNDVRKGDIAAENTRYIFYGGVGKTVASIIWTMYYGVVPKEKIYYKDANKFNRKIENLTIEYRLQHRDIDHTCPKRFKLEDSNEFFSYCKETGVLRWKERRGVSEGGIVAQEKTDISILGKRFQISKIIWFICMNEVPKYRLYYSDKNPSNKMLDNFSLKKPGEKKDPSEKKVKLPKGTNSRRAKKILMPGPTVPNFVFTWGGNG